MRREVKRLDVQLVLQQYPITDRVPGWYFKVEETSPGGYEAEGTDLWGRTVSHHLADPDAVLIACIADAQVIAAEIEEAPS